MNPHALEQSAKSLLTSVIAEGRWLPALEGLMARMDVLGGGIARIAVPAMFAIPTSGLREQFLDFQAGRAPTLTRATPLAPTMDDGFVAEHLCLGEDILKADVFYQDFLRPRGCSHHVSALLDDGPFGAVNLLAFRPEEDGAFEAEELAAYDRILPYLRAATMVA